MDEIEKEPSIGISYTCELPGKKALVMQSFVPRDCPASQLDDVLDKVRVAGERQFAFGAVIQLKLQLEQEEKMARDHASRMAQVDENIKAEWNRGNRRGDPTLSAKQRQDQAQAYAHAEESKVRIAKVRAEIAEFEAKIRPQEQPGA